MKRFLSKFHIIGKLCRTAKERGIPMTVLVAEALDAYLAAEDSISRLPAVASPAYALTEQGRHFLSSQRKVA